MSVTGTEENQTSGGGAPEYDVAIVGASIAGCTAATFLARAGAKVALLESHSDSRTYKRMCTHFIQSSASPTIERLGLRGAIEDAGAQPNGLNMWTRYGWISFEHDSAVSPELRAHPGWNLRRETFDPMLRELAANTDGVDLLLGYTADGLLRAQDGSGGAGGGASTSAGAGRVAGVRARERDGKVHELRAKLTVAADGRDSKLAQLAGQPEKIKPNRRFGYFAHYRDTPLVTGSSAQMWLLDPDMAYAFPTDGGMTLLACMPHRDRLEQFRGEPEQAMERLFAELPDGPRLDPAKRESKMLGKLEMHNVVRQTTAPGLALVGDAAIAADPVWGIGCGWALQSGEWLAEELGGALRGGEAEVDDALQRYAARHRRGLDAHEKFCSAYSKGKRFNPIERLMFRATARDAQLTERMVLMGSRWITPQQMLTPAALARIVRVNLSRASRPRGLQTRVAPASAVA
jgi:2-polyprenyl-6-methoxyphenol hydroxylase-like FAD-dependent oxidoreductase